MGILDVLRGLWTRIRATFTPEATEAELRDELGFHVEKATEQWIDRGLPPDEARRRALVDFGGVERFKQVTRDSRRLPVMDELIRNLRVATRRLWSKPLHTLAVVGTLALGIGANTAIFSVVDAVLLRPSPFPEPDRLVMVWETDRDSDTRHEPASWPDVVDFRERTRAFESLGVMVGVGVTVTDGEVPERVTGLGVTPDFLSALGVEPLAGRIFLEDEGIVGAQSDPTATAAAILGEGYWRSRFDGDPGIVGRTLSLAGGPVTVVGVLPSDADLGIRQVHQRADYAQELGPGSVDLWLAIQPTAEAYPRQTHPFLTVGRLAADASLGAAREELSTVAAELERTHPENTARGVNLESYSEVVFGPVRTGLFLLLGAVGLVLLVACANVANLLLSETSSRRQEVALRRAFGADGGQIGRQFLTESLLLTGLGTLAGVALAYGALEVLLAFAPSDLPRLRSAGLDLRVLAFTGGLAGTVALVFGLLPTLQSRSLDLLASLKAQASRGGTQGSGERRYRSGLVVFEVALAVVLVVGAGILLRSFYELRSVDPGFRTEQVVKAEYELPPRFSEVDEVERIHREFLALARRIPGVQAAALASNHPLDPGFTNSFVIVGREAESADFPEIRVRFISSGYADVTGVPVLEGRSLEDGDMQGGPPVAVINETAATRYFPDGSALGQEFGFWGFQWRVVGVLGDERFQGIDRPVDPAIYVPLSQIPVNAVNLLLRSSRDPEALAAEAGRLLRSVDPEIAVAGVEPMEAVLRASLSRPRFTTTLLGVFAGVAILLALIGVYGVLSYAVARRAPEMGIRLALGASQRDLFREVVLDGFRVTGLGIVLGAGAALAGSHLLEEMVYGVSVTDLGTYLAVVALVLFGATLASVLPAVRAARQDPVGLLKSE